MAAATQCLGKAGHLKSAGCVGKLNEGEATSLLGRSLLLANDDSGQHLPALPPKDRLRQVGHADHPPALQEVAVRIKRMGGKIEAQRVELTLEPFHCGPIGHGLQLERFWLRGASQ